MEPKIVVVESHEVDSYGNTRFTDKDGNEYKVGEKRPKEMHDLIQDGVAVQLFYKVFNDNEYISDVKSVEGELPPPVVAVEGGETIPLPKPKTRDEAIREGMAVKAQEIRRDIVYKMLHEHIMAKTLTPCFGADLAKVLLTEYKDFIQKNL